LETGFPSRPFGEQAKFTIMNYGADSELTDADRSDLKALYASLRRRRRWLLLPPHLQALL